MPLYTVTTQAGVLSGEAKARLAPICTPLLPSFRGSVTAVTLSPSLSVKRVQPERTSTLARLGRRFPTS
jgi:hypothetical protein